MQGYLVQHLLWMWKPMTNVDSIFTSRDMTLPKKVLLVKVMVLPVVMYGYESWTIKKAECQRIDAFEIWCWRLLRVPCMARKSNQSILKEISPDYSLKGLMLNLKLQYFGHLTQRTDSLEKTLLLGKIEGRGEGDNRGQGSWMASPTRWTWVGLSKPLELVMNREGWRAIHEVAKSNWTELEFGSTLENL